MKKYNTSINHSPIKSPSPDNLANNILAPTQIKYISSFTHEERSPMSRSYKHDNRSEHRTQSRYENSSLLQTLTEKNKQLQHENQKLMSIIQKYNNTQPAQKKNQHVIEKIREQYQENIQTLKTMLKLEIQQCMDWAEEVCRFMEGRVSAMHERITSIEESLMKVHAELAEQSMEKKMKGKQYETINLSEVHCESIPEVQEEDSKTEPENFRKSQPSSNNLKHLAEIDQLTETIHQLEQQYHHEKQNLHNDIIEKQTHIQTLTENIHQQQHQTEVMKKQLEDIKLELQHILVNSKGLEHKFDIINIEEKNLQIEHLTREMIILRDKLLTSQQHRFMLQQKHRYLQSNVELLEKQVKERTQVIHDLTEEKFKKESERIVTSKQVSSEVSLTFHEQIQLLSNRIHQLLERAGNS